jgi:hypothetical protein
MTPSEMAEESRKATEEGMRQLANFMRDNKDKVTTRSKNKPVVMCESDSDCTESSVDSKKRKRTRYITTTKQTETHTNSLESTIRYLKLDLVNAEVQIDEQKTTNKQQYEKLMIYLRIDTELSILNHLLEDSMKDISSYTQEQLEVKYNIFTNKTTEHIELCKNAISKVEYQYLASNLLLSLDTIRDTISVARAAFRWIILKRILYSTIVYTLITYAIIGSIVFAMVYAY